MAQPLIPLLKTNLQRWFSAKGFWLVTAAALLPLVLTGSWLVTHQDDVAAVELSWEGMDRTLVQGENVTFTATVKNVGDSPVTNFNSTLIIGSLRGASLSPDATTAIEIDRLAPGETRTMELPWTAKPGTWFALADADTEDAVGEIDEFNNQVPKAVVVDNKAPDQSQAPAASENLAGDESANVTSDVRVDRIDYPDRIAPQDNATFTAYYTNAGDETLDNVTLTLQVGQSFQGSIFAEAEESVTESLAPGETKSVTVTWTARSGAYWAAASANVGSEAHDPDAANNHEASGFAVNAPVNVADLEFPEPPEKLTIKEFYIEILSLLHLRLLIPFIALFYAAGVLADERERGTLPYLLTRPIHRGLIPITKFAAGFLVAAAAITVGLVATFALLFGTPGANLGFLTTPLLASLLSLFTYGAFFVLIGVIVDRPYLVGVAFVVGWETVAGIFVPWVKNITIAQHLQNALGGWRLDEGVQLMPEGDAVRAIYVLLGAGVAFLVASVIMMRRREFDV